MIQIFDDTIMKSGPWIGEFGEYEKNLNSEEKEILEKSSPEIEVLKCKLKNINRYKLTINNYYILKRNNKLETWSYNGVSKINDEYCVFTRPSLNFDNIINFNEKNQKSKKTILNILENFNKEKMGSVEINGQLKIPFEKIFLI